MSQEQLKQKYEKNVSYLRKTIPPDDIYDFTEQTFMAALFFLHKWSKIADLEKECQDCLITQKWVTNILGLQECKDLDLEIQIDMKLEALEDG